jgi:hypothetical protein
VDESKGVVKDVDEGKGVVKDLFDESRVFMFFGMSAGD